MVTVKKTQVEKQVTVKEDAYVLTLNQDEAEALLFLVGKVAGDRKGPAGKTDAIYNALIGAGMPWSVANKFTFSVLGDYGVRIDPK